MYKLLLTLLVIAGVYLFLNNRKSINPDTGQTPPPSDNQIIPVQPKKSITIKNGELSYALTYEKVSDRNLTIIPNFTEKRSASTIAEENKCVIASSGGFYTKDNKPLGLLKIDGTVLNKRVTTTNLLTGFLSYGNDGVWTIGRVPDENFSTIVQSGPFFEKGINFSSNNTETARRIIVFEDLERILYLGALYNETNTRSGPELSKIPELVFSLKQPFTVQKILNLDGGSASFFKYSNGFTLSELVPVGNILCIK